MIAISFYIWGYIDEDLKDCIEKYGPDGLI